MNLRAIAFLSLTIAVSCKSNEPASENSTVQENGIITVSAEQFKAAGITLGTIEKKTIAETVNANGMLDVPPQNLVTLSAPMGGFVKHTHLLQGMYVKKGEALVELQDPQYIQLQQDYLESRSQLEFAEAEYKRQEMLARENVNAQKTLQQARSQFDGLKATVEGLKARLAMINITPADIEQHMQQTIKLYSPIDGYVTEVNINIGKYVQATDMMFKIVDTGHLHAELYIFEQDIAKIKIGQQVLFNLINETTDRLATVHLIGREISPERTVRVHCHLAKEEPMLLPGMYLKARVETGSREVTVMPDESIVNFEGTSYLFEAVSPQTFSMIPVKTGIHENGFTEISIPEGTNQPAQVVIKGAYELLSVSKNTEEE